MQHFIIQKDSSTPYKPDSLKTTDVSDLGIARDYGGGQPYTAIGSNFLNCKWNEFHSPTLLWGEEMTRVADMDQNKRLLTL
jgi:hypothetical protein